MCSAEGTVDRDEWLDVAHHQPALNLPTIHWTTVGLNIVKTSSFRLTLKSVHGLSLTPWQQESHDISWTCVS